uniref:Uncharacterized protein n=1 Tax=Setaria digitata TaxID=48799 RepID=A0A915PQW9_9BILA
MFHACVVILILLTIICTCTVMAVIDLENYNFGLYIILLCVVGTMIACALCVANPNACKNPSWYTKFCLLLQELHPEHLYRGSSSQIPNDPTLSISKCTADNTAHRFRNGNRATVTMLAPAIHIMHHVWKGMAWVTEDISEEERVTNCRTGGSFKGIIFQDESESEHSLRKLSTTIESSSNQPTVSITEDSASGWDPRNDVTL